MTSRKFPALWILGTMFILISCWSSRKATDGQVVSFQDDVYPILEARCTPCHFPEKGKKLPLHTYDACRKNIRDIIKRVTLPQDHREFMPYKLKKEPLSDSMVVVLRQWKDQRFPR